MRLLLTTLVLLLGAWVSVSTGQSSCADETPLGTGTTYRIPAGASLATIPTTLKPGDNVLFQRGGTYKISQSYHVPASGNSTNRILFGAYGTGAKPIIDGSGTTQHYGFNIDGRNWITIDGLEFRNNGVAVHIIESDRITVRRSILRNSRATCLKIHHGSDDALIEFNEIYDCGLTSNGESVYVGTDPANANKVEDVLLRPVIRYNTMQDNEHERLEFKPGVRNGTIEGNVLIGGNQGIMVSHWTGSTFQNSHKIRYNLIANISGSSAVYGMAIRSGAEVYNNVVVNVGGTNRPGIWLHDNQGTGQTITAHHNTVYNASGSGIRSGGGVNVSFSGNLVRASGSGNFAQDPLFFKPATFDFRIPSGSPASGIGAYAVGQALRPVGHTACLGTDPEEPQPLPSPTGLHLVRE